MKAPLIPPPQATWAKARKSRARCRFDSTVSLVARKGHGKNERDRTVLGRRKRRPFEVLGKTAQDPFIELGLRRRLHRADAPIRGNVDRQAHGALESRAACQPVAV